MIRVDGLTKRYMTSKKNIVDALNNINVEFPESGLVCIVGKSGCGKTTFLNCLSSLDEPTEGKIYMSGVNDSEEICLTDLKGQQLDEFRNMNMGVVFQEYNLINEWTVGDNIQIALDVQNWKEKNRDEIDKRIVEALRFVGLEDLRDRYIKELSGGQQQRVAIARAIVKAPRVLLADEPTGNLDSENSKIIMELLKRYSQKCLVIVVTHDTESAEQFADRIISMKDGKIVDDKSNNSEEIKEGKIFADRECVKTKKMSFGNVFHLAVNNLQVKKLKFFFSLLVLIIIVTIGKFCATFVCNNFGKAVSEYLVKNETPFFYTYENLTALTKYEFEENVIVKNRTGLKATLSKEFGEENSYPIMENLYVFTDGSEEAYDCKLVIGGTPGSYKVTGELPKEKDEIAITDYMIYMLELPDDCIGMTVKVNELDMKISGIVSVGVAEELSSEFGSIYNLDIEGQRLIVSEKYPEYLMEQKILRFPFTSLSSNYGLEGDMERIIGISSASEMEEGSYELIYGRMPENASEIVVSEEYAFDDLFISDFESMSNEEYSFMDIHSSRQKDTFDGYLNLFEFMPKVKIVGVISGEEISEIVLEDQIFQEIKTQYCTKYYVDSYEVVLNDKTRDDAEIYNRLDKAGIKLDMGEMEFIFAKKESIRDVDWAYKLILCIVCILLILLLIIFFSFNVKDNHIKIGILKSMGISNRDLMKIWLSEAGIMMTITWLISTVINLIYFNHYNDKFRNNYGFLSDIIHFNFWTEGLIVLILLLLTVLTVVMPIWIMTDKKPVELIRSR